MSVNKKKVSFDPLIHQKKLGRKEPVLGRYEELVAPHLDSFNYFLGPGIRNVVDNLEPIQVCIYNIIIVDSDGSLNGF